MDDPPAHLEDGKSMDHEWKRVELVWKEPEYVCDVNPALSKKLEEGRECPSRPSRCTATDRTSNTRPRWNARLKTEEGRVAQQYGRWFMHPHEWHLTISGAKRSKEKNISTHTDPTTYSGKRGERKGLILYKEFLGRHGYRLPNFLTPDSEKHVGHV
eukprot:TRINITY_DN18849_c0_g1_i1.p2 TRINITY_DN18849_c0_g1~~TRINITY_DN18849_c0_g1_i1.p2  ORF type:complete len:178 (-),score=45.33 TRINITY_DN18849_c0_g1_i1:36-506(-)